MNLTASFTAPPKSTVLSGRTEIGRTDPDLLTEEIVGSRKLLLTRRAQARLAEARETHLDVVHRAGTVITRRGHSDMRWWTWLGTGRTRPWPRPCRPWSCGTGSSTTASSGCVTT